MGASLVPYFHYWTVEEGRLSVVEQALIDCFGPPANLINAIRATLREGNARRAPNAITIQYFNQQDREGEHSEHLPWHACSHGEVGLLHRKDEYAQLDEASSSD